MVGQGTLKILVFGSTRAVVQEFAERLAKDPSTGTVDTAEGSLERLAPAVARTDPELVFVLAADAGPEVLAGVERIEQLYPQLTVVLICANHAPEFLVEAMRAGVREVLPPDVTAETLRVSTARLAKKRDATTDQRGKVLAFIACKGGGSGATFLATNLAYALAENEQQRVIVIDLNLQWGDAAFFVSDRKPASTLADIATQIHRVDAAYLASSLVSAHPRLGILAAPDDPVQALEVKPEHIDVLLRIARSNYDWVILDAGRALDGVTVRALDYADTIYPVLQASLPFIRDGKRLAEAFRSLGYSGEKVRLVVNRYEKGAAIGLADIEKAMAIKVSRTFPNDFAIVDDAINQGMPVQRLAGGSAIAKALREFAHELAATPKKEAGSWLSRVLSRA